jgi:hypothetical protein
VFLRWEKGRQEGSYSKLALIPQWLSKFLKADAYLLSLEDGSTIPKHKDPTLSGYKHYRMNITLTGKSRMYCLGRVKRFGPIDIFRPDLYEHGIVLVHGKMFILSIGWLTKE